MLGLILERLYKVGLAAPWPVWPAASPLLIAHNLALGGDTGNDARRVGHQLLPATHVVVVTLGYAATFMAGTLAMAYVVLGFSPGLGLTPMSPVSPMLSGSRSRTS